MDSHAMTGKGRPEIPLIFIIDTFGRSVPPILYQFGHAQQGSPMIEMLAAGARVPASLCVVIFPDPAVAVPLLEQQFL